VLIKPGEEILTGDGRKAARRVDAVPVREDPRGLSAKGFRDLLSLALWLLTPGLEE
jgi:hypothetical protein